MECGASGRLFGKAARVGSATRIALAFRPGATADGRRRRACASDCAGIHAGANARETWREGKIRGGHIACDLPIERDTGPESASRREGRSQRQ